MNEQQTQEASNEFSPYVLFEFFKESLRKTDNKSDFDDVSLAEYIRAYEEINKFLECLGTIFYFVITDVKEKIGILDGFIKKDPENYKTLRSMVKYEHSQNMFVPPASNTRTSATRTVLRLHRALIFVNKFLERLFTAEPKYKASQICTECYESTLAKHHSWLVRKAAVFGMMALPKRETLLGYMCKNEKDLENYPLFISTVQNVYDITQSIYEKYQILDLP